MTEQDLKDLKHRCKYAISHGFDMAKTDELAAELVEEGATKPSSKHPSPAELLRMVKEVEASFEGSGEPMGVHGHHVTVNVEVAKPAIVVNPVKPSKKSVAPKAKEPKEDERVTVVPEETAPDQGGHPEES